MTLIIISLVADDVRPLTCESGFERGHNSAHNTMHSAVAEGSKTVN